MFAYIRGILIQATPTTAILETQGVGYLINIPTSAFSRLPQIGSELILHTSFIVREQSQALYGFMTTQDREIFEELLNVSGIGPRLALNIVGTLLPNDLLSALQNGDIVTLSKVPGIGKKMAERLVIELRGKLENILPSLPSAVQIPKNQSVRDAMSALINLGYNQAAAQRAIKKTLEESQAEIDLPTLITLSLQNI